MTKNIKRPTTFRIKQLVIMNNKLLDGLPSVMSQFIWKHKISMEDKMRYITCISNIRADLFTLVEDTYAEFKGKKFYVNEVEIGICK